MTVRLLYGKYAVYIVDRYSSHSRIGSNTMAGSTMYLVDDKPVPAKDAHPDPCLLEVGEAIAISKIAAADILHTMAQHKRLDFVAIDNSRLSISVRSVKRGVPGTLVCIVDLGRSSCVQLRAPIDTVAVMTIDIETSRAVLTCERIGLARVTRVTRESASNDDIWVTSLILNDVTSHWDSDTPQYKVNQLVLVRLSAHGSLIAM